MNGSVRITENTYVTTTRFPAQLRGSVTIPENCWKRHDTRGGSVELRIAGRDSHPQVAPASQVGVRNFQPFPHLIRFIEGEMEKLGQTHVTFV